MVAADDLAVFAEAFRQLGGAVAAAVGERGRLALGVEAQHDVLAEQGERLRAVLRACRPAGAYQKRRKTFCLVQSMALPPV